MNSNTRKKHWEQVFQTKDTTKASWYQAVPETSLKLIESLEIDKNEAIIEIGSGDSYLADFLLKKGFINIALLDISGHALETVKKRLGETVVSYITSDVTELHSEKKFKVWHDRAVFHFLTKENEVQKYIETAAQYIEKNGYLILGTFSENGPEMCSGLYVKQYNETELTKTFASRFAKIRCFTQNHTTPSGSVQNFIFCIFRKI